MHDYSGTDNSVGTDKHRQVWDRSRLASPWIGQSPLLGLTDGTTVLKVLGSGQITIEHVGVVIDPTWAPIRR